MRPRGLPADDLPFMGTAAIAYCQRSRRSEGISTPDVFRFVVWVSSGYLSTNNNNEAVGACAKPRLRGFASSGGRALGVHGSGSVHSRGAGEGAGVRVAYGADSGVG